MDRGARGRSTGPWWTARRTGAGAGGAESVAAAAHHGRGRELVGVLFRGAGRQGNGTGGVGKTGRCRSAAYLRERGGGAAGSTTRMAPAVVVDGARFSEIGLRVSRRLGVAARVALGRVRARLGAISRRWQSSVHVRLESRGGGAAVSETSRARG